MASKYYSQTQEELVSRLLFLYGNATPAQRDAGENWYPKAAAFAGQLAAQYDIPMAVAAGVVAVVSPQTSWKDNKAVALSLVAAHAGGERMPTGLVGYPANRAKAWRMLDGEGVCAVLNGPKVVPFWHNILGKWDVVTVDIHACRAAYGHKFAHAPTGPQRDYVAMAYENAAHVVRVAPAVFQAVVWCVVRGSAE
jgi:hypothetical protein